jgi:hypothetical protein
LLGKLSHGENVSSMARAGSAHVECPHLEAGGGAGRG